jgi:tetratricopeptide (TPR) repeat protein
MRGVASWLLAPFRMARRHPLLSIALLAVAIAATAAGVHLWALHEFQEAQRALDDGDLAGASRHVSFCMTVWPRSSATHFLAARVCRVAGYYAEAEAQLDECRALEGSTPKTQLEMLLVRAQRGEADQVGEGLLYAADNDPAAEQEILEALARGHMNQMRLLPALGLLNRCLTHHPDDVRALDWRGWVLERLDQQDRAILDYKHALELSPGRVDVRLRLAEIYLDRNDPVQAEPHLLILAKSVPNRPDILLATARCSYLQGRIGEARDLLDRVLAVQPDMPGALIYRGKIEFEGSTPRPEAAERYFRLALKNDPHDAAVHRALFDSLRAQPGREAEAEQELQKTKELTAAALRMQALLKGESDRPSEDVESAYELGKLNMELGQDDLAAYWLRTAEKRDANHKPTHALLADLLEKKGFKDEADRERALAAQ